MGRRQRLEAIRHEGLHLHRIRPELDDDTAREERAFAETWKDEAKPRPGVNRGGGILQDFMFVPQPESDENGWGSDAGYFAYEIRQDDATIVATMMQALGTNWGRSFLHTALAKVGKTVVTLEERQALFGRTRERRRIERAILEEVRMLRETDNPSAFTYRLNYILNYAAELKKHA